MPGRSAHQRDLDQRRRALVRQIGDEIRRQREDGGLTRAALAREAGIDPSHLGRIEDAEREASISALLGVAYALGADLRVRLYPGSGPRIRDRHQARMIEALLARLHPRWTTYLEVPVSRPVRGVVDIVLHDPASGQLIAVESESTLPRLEQQLRWSTQKAEGLARDARWSAPGIRRSSLLLLRSTATARALASAVPATFAAAFPAAPGAALASLEGQAPWPGDALIWVALDRGSTRLLPGPPRGLMPRP